MLTENCIPWLIEINSGPSMSPSTSITARMCPQVMDDVIKGKISQKVFLQYNEILEQSISIFYFFSGYR